MPATNPGTTGLVAWWSLDEASGQRNDSHGTNHLTDNNTVLSAVGLVGTAADFENTNAESLSLADAADAFDPTGGFTVGLWLKPESDVTNVRIAGAGSAWSTAGMEWSIVGSTSPFPYQFFLWSNSASTTLTSAQNITSGTWQFVVAWYDPAGPTIGIQIDANTPDTIASVAVDDEGASRQVYLGRTLETVTARYVDGLADEAFFYSRVLTADERTWLYNAGAGRSYADLTAGNPVAIIQQQHWRSVWAGGVPVG